MAFPPPGPLPNPPNMSAPGCDIWTDIYYAASLVNPCFDLYQVATTCPLLWDVLGFPGSFNYLPAGAQVYFNRTDVQRAINAPIQVWSECASNVLTTDTSPWSGLSVLPHVIERYYGPQLLLNYLQHTDIAQDKEDNHCPWKSGLHPPVQRHPHDDPKHDMERRSRFLLRSFSPFLRPLSHRLLTEHTGRCWEDGNYAY